MRTGVPNWNRSSARPALAGFCINRELVAEREQAATTFSGLLRSRQSQKGNWRWLFCCWTMRETSISILRSDLGCSEFGSLVGLIAFVIRRERLWCADEWEVVPRTANGDPIRIAEATVRACAPQ